MSECQEPSTGWVLGKREFVPLTRFEYAAAMDGKETRTGLGLAPGVSVAPNERLHPEYFTDLRRPGGGTKDNRVTLFAVFGF